MVVPGLKPKLTESKTCCYAVLMGLCLSFSTKRRELEDHNSTISPVKREKCNQILARDKGLSMIREHMREKHQLVLLIPWPHYTITLLVLRTLGPTQLSLKTPPKSKVVVYLPCWQKSKLTMLPIGIHIFPCCSLLSKLFNCFPCLHVLLESVFIVEGCWRVCSLLKVDTLVIDLISLYIWYCDHCFFIN